MNSLMGFLMRGGELVGFVGRHIVGYVFAANQAVLIQEIVGQEGPRLQFGHHKNLGIKNAFCLSICVL